MTINICSVPYPHNQRASLMFKRNDEQVADVIVKCESNNNDNENPHQFEEIERFEEN